MKNRAKSVVATLSLVASAATFVPVSGAAPAVATKYFACSSGGTLSHISTVAHACAKATKAVSGLFSGADFTYADFSGAVLTGASLSRSTLASISSGKIVGRPASLPNGWHLVNGYLIGPTAVIQGANFTNTNFSNINLAGASILSSNFTGAIFNNVSLANATMSNVTVANAQFGKANLNGLVSAFIAGTPRSLPSGWTVLLGSNNGTPENYLGGPSAQLGQANLPNAVMTNLQLTGAYFANANLKDADLTGSILTKAVMSAADLEGATLQNVKAAGASFQTANLSGADFTNANLSGANFTGANMLGSVYTGATLTGAICYNGAPYDPVTNNCFANTF